MKIAIIGSREGFNYEDIARVMAKEFAGLLTTLITGGARGVDSFALDFAKKDCISYEIIRPINPSNKMDYLFRNVEIISKADKIICFWDGVSRGTKFVIDYAKARGKDIIVIPKIEDLK